MCTGFLRGVWWDGSKSHRRSSMTHDRICIWNRDGSKFEPFILLWFSLRNIDHVSFCRSGSIFLARKNWDGSKFGEKLNSKQNDSNFEPSQFFRAKKSEPLRQKDTWSLFRRENKGKMDGSNFEPSRFQMQMLSCVNELLRWLFEPSHLPPRMKKEKCRGNWIYAHQSMTVIDKKNRHNSSFWLAEN